MAAAEPGHLEFCQQFKGNGFPVTFTEPIVWNAIPTNISIAPTILNQKCVKLVYYLHQFHIQGDGICPQNIKYKNMKSFIRLANVMQLENGNMMNCQLLSVDCFYLWNSKLICKC